MLYRVRFLIVRKLKFFHYLTASVLNCQKCVFLLHQNIELKEIQILDINIDKSNKIKVILVKYESSVATDVTAGVLSLFRSLDPKR